jgi:hypothetical protein
MPCGYAPCVNYLKLETHPDNIYNLNFYLTVNILMLQNKEKSVNVFGIIFPFHGENHKEHKEFVCEIFYKS